MHKNRIVTALVMGCLTASTATGAGFFDRGTKRGEGGTEVTKELTHCARPIGTAALLEGDHPGYAEYGLTSPVPLVKLMMARSNCFQVVDRGASSAALKYERELAASGELQKGSQMGGGQMAAADYIITPQIVHKDSDAGGGGAGLGSLLPGRIGAVAGAFRTKNLEAQVLLSVTNVRTSVQEAIAEGSASKSDLSIGGLGFIGGLGGAAGAYDNTDIGKITASAFLDAHNKLVEQLGYIPEDAASQDNAGFVVATQVNFRAGPSTKAPVLALLYEGTSVIPTGNKNGQWWEIEALGKTGWVHSDYLTR